jgi:hypothetical protein
MHLVRARRGVAALLVQLKVAKPDPLRLSLRSAFPSPAIVPSRRQGRQYTQALSTTSPLVVLTGFGNPGSVQSPRSTRNRGVGLFLLAPARLDAIPPVLLLGSRTELPQCGLEIVSPASRDCKRDDAKLRTMSSQIAGLALSRAKEARRARLYVGGSRRDASPAVGRQGARRLSTRRRGRSSTSPVWPPSGTIGLVKAREGVSDGGDDGRTLAAGE